MHEQGMCIYYNSFFISKMYHIAISTPQKVLHFIKR